MARLSPLTYHGALALLGQGADVTLVKIVDKVASAGILVSAALFPGAVQLIDVKNEVVELLGDLASKAAGRLSGAAGKDRLDLIEAAHTMLVLSSFFDAMCKEFGPRFKAFNLTGDEVIGIARSGGGPTESQLVETMLVCEFPLPSAHRGFSENLDGPLFERLSKLSKDTLEFLTGLAAWREPRTGLSKLADALANSAAKTYRDRYQCLAAAAPEFGMWAALGEHSATRTAIRVVDEKVEAVLQEITQALGKTHDLLTLAGTSSGPHRTGYRAILARGTAAILDKPLLRTGELESVLRFPTVAQGFVAPRFRMAVQGKETRASVEDWWSIYTLVRNDIDAFLAAHLSHPEATRLPLIVLGHPGAGKSLLASVLAARLPVENFTVVPVLLRRVNADDSLADQIQQALRGLLGEDVAWGMLARESAGTTRVVILDGLDELIQATGTTQSRYLSEVRAFQEQQDDLGRPVAVIVTSRTLVVDRARIPEGSVIIKLEDFDDDQLAQWVKAWNESNGGNASFVALDPAELIGYCDGLARQPLLLAMIAIYVASIGSLEKVDSAPAALYERLLNGFIERQIVDKSATPPDESQRAGLTAARLAHLSLVAFGMFNRGRQYISEAHLNADLDAFVDPDDSLAPTGFAAGISRAHHIAGDFFFVHVAQAGTPAESDVRRTYEFLHATFGEYLISERTLKLAIGLNRERNLFLSDPSVHAPADDGQLRALLCHEPLQLRGQIIKFLRQLCDRLPEEVRAVTADALASTLQQARRRVLQRNLRYLPTLFDVVNHAAAYTQRTL